MFAVSFLVATDDIERLSLRPPPGCDKAMPTTHTSRHEGVELALRRGNEQAAQMLVQAPGDGAVARPSRRRSTLADISKDLEDLEQQPRWRWRAKVALVFYTLARITMNIPFTERESYYWVETEEGSYSRKSAGKYVDFHVVGDAICRPLVTGFGLYIFVHRLDRFSWSNQLQLLSFVTMCCLALPLCDESVEHLLNAFHRKIMPKLNPNFVSMLCWEILCNVLQVYMTILKLGALGWHRTARWCCVLTKLGVVSFWLGVLMQDFFGMIELSGIIIFISFGCCFTVVGIQCLALCCAASRAMEQARGNGSIWWTACFLYANACLVPLGPALSFVGLGAFLDKEYFLPLTVLTLDVTFQVFNVLLLSGMVGTNSMNLEALQRLAELSGFGLASARVAFPGHISQSATDCVVSFPGKYSDLWDKAVSSVTQQDTFSLACVFLTDTASGLGRHAENPDTPGNCWCRQIYGPLPAATYLSVVQVSADESQSNDQTLAFKRADAEAMGQRLLIKQHQGDIEWEQELAEALQDAEVRCVENQYRAPWGCQWFEKWKQNVDRAAELHQTLHVFYFEDGKGKGKMPWELLANERARHDARKNSGLGASQTAEVAYLDKVGLSYVEHDIMEFAAFLSSRT